MATLKEVIKSLVGAVEEGYGDAEVWVCACPICTYGHILRKGSITADMIAWKVTGVRAINGGATDDPDIVIISGACEEEDESVVCFKTIGASQTDRYFKH